MSIKIRDYISEELENDIRSALKERRSVEQIMREDKFVGTEKSVESFMHLLVDIIGGRMALEFLFSSQVSIWEEYRNLLDGDAWRSISKTGQFTSANYLLLGESIIQREDIELGKEFINKSIELVTDDSFYNEIAEVISYELSDKKWVKEILLKAEKNAITSDEITKLAVSTITLADDEEHGRELYKSASEKATKFDEFTSIATAIARTLKDRAWAEEVFAKTESLEKSGSPLEMLAEEDFREQLEKYC